MNDVDLAGWIKSMEDTLCCLPFEPQHKRTRAELTKVVNALRAMLVDRIRFPDSIDASQGVACVDGPVSIMRLEESGSIVDQGVGLLPMQETDVVRVLIVENEPIVALLLRLVLENHGYSVRDVPRRANAIDEIDSWDPDVIVTDLPIADTPCAEFVAQMRTRVRTRSVLVVATAWDGAARPGVDAVFVKPYEAEEVVKRIESLLAGKAGQLHCLDYEPRPSEYRDVARFVVQCDVAGRASTRR